MFHWLRIASLEIETHRLQKNQIFRKSAVQSSFKFCISTASIRIRTVLTLYFPFVHARPYDGFLHLFQKALPVKHLSSCCSVTSAIKSIYFSAKFTSFFSQLRSSFGFWSNFYVNFQPLNVKSSRPISIRVNLLLIRLSCLYTLAMLWRLLWNMCIEIINKSYD